MCKNVWCDIKNLQHKSWCKWAPYFPPYCLWWICLWWIKAKTLWTIRHTTFWVLPWCFLPCLWHLYTLASTKSDCSLSSVQDFTWSRGLSLKLISKYMRPSLYQQPPPAVTLDGGDICIPVSDVSKCLGAWWSSDLSCSTWIYSNIKDKDKHYWVLRNACLDVWLWVAITQLLL